MFTSVAMAWLGVWWVGGVLGCKGRGGGVFWAGGERGRMSLLLHTHASTTHKILSPTHKPPDQFNNLKKCSETTTKGQPNGQTDLLGRGGHADGVEAAGEEAGLDLHDLLVHLACNCFGFWFFVFLGGG
jgi:hypothetical protein